MFRGKGKQDTAKVRLSGEITSLPILGKKKALKSIIDCSATRKRNDKAHRKKGHFKKPKFSYWKNFIN